MDARRLFTGVVAVVTALALAVPANAGEKGEKALAIVAYAGATIADIGSTKAALSNPNVVETNALNRGSITQQIAVHVALMGVSFAAHRKLIRDGKRTAAWVALLVTLMGYGWIVAKNLSNATKRLFGRRRRFALALAA